MVYKVLRDDKDVMQMLSHLSKKCRVLSIYVDNGKKSGEHSEILTSNVTGDSVGETSDLTRSDEETLEKYVGEDYKVSSEEYADWNSAEDDDYMPSTEDSDERLSENELASDDEI
ncbi:hypothetical protein C2S52_008173 [Perilla frutescens var. hirtella]|nr:hypothetical protein C2S52_008173 [Perilla frutescens var. hirtella]